MISDYTKGIIIEHARREFPKECCGLVWDDGIVAPCKNMAKNPEESFLISSEEYKWKVEKGFPIIAFYHSHPKGGPIHILDRCIAERLKLKSIVYNCPDKSFEEYEPSGNPFPYIGRPFMLGVLDCITLVIDYYKSELNIDIPDIEHENRNDDWLNSPQIVNSYNYKNCDILVNHFTSNGFRKVDETKKHDVILTTSYKVKCPIHCLIYQGGNKILHHPANGYSEISDYGIYYKKRTTHYLRHAYAN